MRITHNMMRKNYIGQMNKNLKNLTNSNDKLASQRSFNRAYENIGDANRVLRTRALVADNERAQKSIDIVSGTYRAAEDGMMAVNTTINKVTDLVMKSTSGTYSEADREIIASEIVNLQDQVFQIMNSKFGDKYTYGASGNRAGSVPFTTDPATGALMYQGTNVDTMKNVGGVISDAAGIKIPFNDNNHIDVGLGFTVGADGKVDPRTAIQSTFSGVELFGYGTDANGSPNNIYSLLGQMSKEIKNGNMDEMQKSFEHLQTRQKDLLVQIANTGSMTDYIDQTQERLSAEELTLQTVQNGLEAVDLSEEIMYNKDYEMSWMVTLQLGSKVLPPSIFDFIR